jgi:hypothetical protein
VPFHEVIAPNGVRRHAAEFASAQCTQHWTRQDQRERMSRKHWCEEHRATLALGRERNIGA